MREKERERERLNGYCKRCPRKSKAGNCGRNPKLKSLFPCPHSGVSWLFYCKVSGQHLKVAVFTSQLPWLLCVEGAGQPGREAGGLVQCGSSGYDEKGLG